MTVSSFPGKLRPAEQSERRIVPDHIPRPDYSDHPEGFPISEQRLKGNTYVRQLDSDEIDGKDDVFCDTSKNLVQIGNYTKRLGTILVRAQIDSCCYYRRLI